MAKNAGSKDNQLRKLMIAVNRLEKSCHRIEKLRNSVSDGVITSVQIENALEKEWDAIDEIKDIVNGVVCDVMDSGGFKENKNR
jgi:hypothetical protein